MNNAAPPVIFLAFSNDRDDYLKMIERERAVLYSALQDRLDAGAIRVHKQENTAIKDVFEQFRRYADNISIFHYGGHASGTALQLETGGEAQMAHADGLAQLFGQSAGLQLVFLNGCATKGQVETLLSCGVKTVIATAVPINDTMATEFAEQFYLALANKFSIGRAFETARAFIAATYGKDARVGAFRAIDWDGEAPTSPEDASATADASLTWGLYVNTTNNGAAALDWVLPDVAARQVIIRGAPPSAKAGAAVNVGLITTLLAAVAPHSLQLRQSLEIDKDSDNYDERIFPQLIVDSFPAPVGEQLRKLFAGNIADAGRLRQIVVTYETIAKLFCFTLLSQLWDVRQARGPLAMTDEQRAAVNSFMALTADSQPMFDYFKLILAIAGIFKANGVTPFMAECAELETTLADRPSTAAHDFMEELRAELHKGPIATGEVESFCLQAEAHLATLVADFAFVVRYKLATIKGIDIVKSRHKPPQFVFRQVLLDRVTAGMKDSTREYGAFTDNESVIIQKNRKDVADYLNLTPFVIDENALTRNENSKLYFYSHHEEADDTYHYCAVADADDRLAISDSNYPAIKLQCGEFRDAVIRQ